MSMSTSSTGSTRSTSSLTTLSSGGGASGEITIRRYTDARPTGLTSYFTKQAVEGSLGVIVPFYNEESRAVQVTLQSLLEAFGFAGRLLPAWNSSELLQVLLIQDGWYKASASMQSYLKALFPHKVEGQDWWEYYSDFKSYNQAEDGNPTYVFESTLPLPIMGPGDTSVMCNVSLLIKIDNRKKHNSHEWFLGAGGFAECMRAKYLFCTDAFTLFNKSCVYHLLQHMEEHPSTAVVTGRQRVMSKKQQGSSERLLSMGTLLRMVQQFDFETSNVVYVGAFSLGGFLPVVPGPCGMYRASVLLQPAVRDWYFDIVNQEPNKTGLVLGNLRIAEDRILTYSVVLKAQVESYMRFVPLAIFYFEAETDLRQLLLQRRRWINGSVAGYLFLLFFGFTNFTTWKTYFVVRKLYVWFLLMCQFFELRAGIVKPVVFNNNLLLLGALPVDVQQFGERGTHRSDVAVVVCVLDAVRSARLSAPARGVQQLDNLRVVVLQYVNFGGVASGVTAVRVGQRGHGKRVRHVSVGVLDAGGVWRAVCVVAGVVGARPQFVVHGAVVSELRVVFAHVDSGVQQLLVFAHVGFIVGQPSGERVVFRRGAGDGSSQAAF